MATTPETLVKRRLQKYFKAHGWLYIAISSRFHSGLPDGVAISPAGVHWWIEVKRPGARPTPLQWHTMKKLWNQNAIACWYDGSVAPEEVFVWDKPPQYLMEDK